MSEISIQSTSAPWRPAAAPWTVPYQPAFRGRPAGQGPDDRPGAIDAEPISAGFSSMRAALRSSGGLARGDDLARLLEDSLRGDFISLARLIAHGEVFGFAWRQTFWVPVFQFDLRDLSLRPAARHVRRELPADFDGWKVSAWFVRPNRWLDEEPPVALLQSNTAAVLAAARAADSGVVG